MASPLGALLEALGQGGMNIAQFKVKEKNDALARALEEARFKETADLNRRQLELQGQQFELQNADRMEGRRLQQEQREQSGAQYAVNNFGGQEVDDERASLIEKYVPGGITRKTDITDVSGEAPINGLPVSQAFKQTNRITETQPASVRNALLKAQSDAAKLAATQEHQKRMAAISQARVEVMRQRNTIAAGELEGHLRRLDQLEQEANDDFEIAKSRLEVSLYNTDSRADLGNDFMSSFLSGLPGGGGVPAGPAKPATPPPVRPTLPTRSGGGGGAAVDPTSSIDALIGALLSKARGGR